jgi:hypothetical protein
MPPGTRGVGWDSLAKALRAVSALRDTTVNASERRIYFEIGSPKLIANSATYEFEILIRDVTPCRLRTFQISGTRQRFRIGGPEGWAGPRRHIGVEFDTVGCS